MRRTDWSASATSRRGRIRVPAGMGQYQSADRFPDTPFQICPHKDHILANRTRGVLPPFHKNMQPLLDVSQAARNVLLPVNLTEHSRRALDWYAANIYKSDDVIHVLYILEPSYAANNFGLTAGGGQVQSGEINSMLAEHIELSKTLGHEFLLRIQERGLQGNYVLSVGTRPGEQIVSYAKENNVDLIVMGSRGVGALRRTVFGSVSDYVLHRVNIPMAVVPFNKVPKETRRYSMK